MKIWIVEDAETKEILGTFSKRLDASRFMDKEAFKRLRKLSFQEQVKGIAPFYIYSIEQ